jgi:hypothetical protein
MAVTSKAAGVPPMKAPGAPKWSVQPQPCVGPASPAIRFGLFFIANAFIYCSEAARCSRR